MFFYILSFNTNTEEKISCVLVLKDNLYKTIFSHKYLQFFCSKKIFLRKSGKMF